jgi:hypothetical protein
VELAEGWREEEAGCLNEWLMTQIEGRYGIVIRQERSGESRRDGPLRAAIQTHASSISDITPTVRQHQTQRKRNAADSHF